MERARKWKPQQQARGEPVVLLIHGSGRWARKIDRSLRHFGPVTDRAGDFGYWNALKLHNAALTGPVRVEGGRLALADLCNRFLEIKEEERDRGELTEAHFANLHRVGKLPLDQFGKVRIVETLGPRDFDKLHADLIFITKYGKPWLRYTRKGETNQKDFRVVRRDSIGGAITRINKELGIHRNGLGIYAIRHGFQTIADGARDLIAVQTIMGHADQSMSETYRESMSDEQLQAVVEHVRNWHCPDGAGTPTQQAN